MESTMDARWQIGAFLDALFGHYEDPNAWIEFRALAQDASRPTRIWMPLSDLLKNRKRAAKEVHEWASAADDAGRDVYVGVLPRADRGRATKGDIPYCGITWADVDFKVLDRSRADEIIAVVEPALVVDTGGGYHVYNRLDRAFPVDEDTLPRIERAVMGYQRRFGPVDPTHDLTRILRVPGTHNHKPERGNAEVRLVVQNGCPLVAVSPKLAEEAEYEARKAVVREQRRLTAAIRWAPLLEAAEDFPYPVRIWVLGPARPALTLVRLYMDEWVRWGTDDKPVTQPPGAGLIRKAEGILEDLSDMVLQGRGFLVDGIAVPDRLRPDNDLCLPLGGI